MENGDNSKGRKQVYHLIVLKNKNYKSLTEINSDVYYNDALRDIRSLQERYIDSQDHYVTVIISSYRGVEVVKQTVPIYGIGILGEDGVIISEGTTLRDAVGFGILKMIIDTGGIANLSVLVTAIAYDMDDSISKLPMLLVYSLIDRCKVEGWIFNFIGYNELSVKRV